MRSSTTVLAIMCILLSVWASAAFAQQHATSPRQGNWLAMANEIAQAAPEPAAAEDAAKTPQASDKKPFDEPKEEPLSLAGQKSWEIKFKVYGWVPGYDGEAGPGRRISTVDVNYCDVLRSLDLVECMVPVNLEARYGKWGFYADLFYARLEDDVTVGPRGGSKVTVRAQQTILELGGFYRVGTWPVIPKSSSSITLDVIGGARYNRLEGNLSLQTPRRSFSIGGPQEWWDPFIGPRVIWQANEKLNFFARADIGGFGLENSSHLAWQIIAGAGYDITKNFFVEAGYRLLDTNYETGSGRRKFTYDVMMQGPYMALGVKF